jgi:hypothetical protein
MKIKIEGAVYFRTKRDYDWQSPMVFLEGPAEGTSAFRLLAPHTIEIEAPDFDQTAAELETLRQRRKEIHDQFAAAVMKIDQRINSLLAIENSAEAVPE